jgi:uncharacterized protein (DUF849 family)
VLIKAAINGGRSKAEHPAVPIAPEEQAADVIKCLKAGAGAVHLHVRGTSGNSARRRGEVPRSLHSDKESLYVDDVEGTFAILIPSAHGVAVGVSTGEWILPDPAERLNAIASWKLISKTRLPDFASVNFSEKSAVETARLLYVLGIAVEAGLSDVESAESFLRSYNDAIYIRVLIEPQEQKMKEALKTVAAIEEVLDAETIELPRLLHGTEATAWPMMDEAIAREYGVRVGLEDTLLMPDGKMATDNAELLTEAVRRVRNSGQ